jgi:hypothetical protein
MFRMSTVNWKPFYTRGSAPFISAEHVSADHNHEAGELMTHIFWLVLRSDHVGVNYQFFQASDVIIESALNPLLLLPPPFPRWQEM